MQGSPGSGIITGSLQNIPEGEYARFDKSQGLWPKEQLTFLDDPTVFLAIELVSSLSGYYSFFVCSTLDPSFLPSCCEMVCLLCIAKSLPYLLVFLWPRCSQSCFFFFPSGGENHYLKKKKEKLVSYMNWNVSFYFLPHPNTCSLSGVVKHINTYYLI